MTHCLVWKLLPKCSKNSRFGQYANNYLALYVNSPFMYNVEKETNIILKSYVVMTEELLSIFGHYQHYA